jgi:putative ABC transport system substrate-binding protein
MKLSRLSLIWRSAGTVVLGIALLLATTYPSWAETKGSPRVAVLTPGATFEPVFRGLQEGLSRLGYRDGQSINFIVDDTKGSTADLNIRANKLVEAKPDVLYAVATAHSMATKQSTSTIPFVFAWVADPLQSRIISSYASSNSNATGVSVGSDSLSGKRLEALLAVAPKIKKVLAVMAPKEQIAERSFQFLQETAKKLAIQVVRRDASKEEEIKRALQETPKGSVDAIYHVPSALVGSHIGLLIEKAKQDKIPLVAHEDSIVEKGALVSFGPDFRLVGIQSARLVAKVLKGEKPSQIPSETPEKLLLVINVSVAKAIGLKVPRNTLEQADRLVE